MRQGSRRLRVKPEHTPFRIAGGLIRIGGGCYGIAGEVTDLTGSVWTLLQAMNGRRSDEQIVEHVLARHPDESATDVHDALEMLATSGYVEDVAIPDPDELTNREKERYERARQFFRWVGMAGSDESGWTPQLTLRRARVTVIGVGGVGGSAALALAMSGVGRIHCVDGDDVELSNLNRQILFTEADVGRSKAEVAGARLRQHNSDITVTDERLEITGVEQLRTLAEACDVLVLCADRPAQLGVWVNRACLATARPWVWAGYHGPRVTMGIFVPGQGPCYECLRAHNEAHYRALGAYFNDARWLLGEPIGNAVMAPTAGLGGYLAAHAAMALLTRLLPMAPGRLHLVNLVDLDERPAMDFERIPGCAGCGSMPGVSLRSPGGVDVGAG